jgi:hypothetical protein
MVIHNLDIVSVSVAPHETHTPLIVNPDAMLAGAIAFEGLQSVARGRCQVSQLRGNIELPKLALRHPSDRTIPRHLFPAMKPLGLLRPERPDHHASV